MSKEDRKLVFILGAIAIAYLIWQKHEREECREVYLPYDPGGYEDCLWVRGL